MFAQEDSNPSPSSLPAASERPEAAHSRGSDEREEQPSEAPSPMVVRPSGRLIDARDEQPEKA